ncbi:MAG: 16S rRNA processing protein RimM [Lachnospiraceae bacterium]|nr:16S rRNA processing protein RimM [Lachnospiraceae bacterium]
MKERLQVGVISSTHGVRGEVKVFPTTDDMTRFKKLKEVILVTEKTEKVLKITSVKFFKQFAILKFDGIDTLNDVEVYKGASLFVDRKNAVKLEKDEYFIADLIDLTVVDESGNKLGTLIDVMKTGANDVYIVKNDEEKELLFPAIKECVLDIDFKEKKMTVHVMDGLLD